MLAADTWYMATVRGTISYERDGHMLYADALYLTDESTNRSTKQENLYFDPPAELVASNPAKHEFLFRFHGTGKRLSALFFGWQRAQLRVDARADILGSLQIDLTEAEHDKNNLPEVLMRWEERDAAERERPRTAQSFCVPKEEIAGSGGYDLSFNRYKEVERSDVKHEAPADIIRELKRLETEIAGGLAKLEEMVE